MQVCCTCLCLHVKRPSHIILQRLPHFFFFCEFKPHQHALVTSHSSHVQCCPERISSRASAIVAHRVLQGV